MKTRLGILPVIVRDEFRIRQQVGYCPFPDIAEHLTATKRTVSGGHAVNIDSAHGLPIKVRVRCRWC